MNLRTAQYPTDLLVAEVFAAPFWMPIAVRDSITSLSQMVSRPGSTQRLYRQMENYLLPRFPAVNLDELVEIRDHVWFSQNLLSDEQPSNRVPLYHIALDLVNILLMPPTASHTSLSPQGMRARRSQGGTSDRNSEANRLRIFRRLYYWLSTALPSDFTTTLIRQSSILSPNDRGIRQCAELLDSKGVSRSVRHLLHSKGMAESHLHLGAAFDFSDFWIALMHRIGSPQFGPDDFKSPGAEWKEGARLAKLVLRAGLLRLLLARFLASNINTGQNKPVSFSDLLNSLNQTMVNAGGASVLQEIDRTVRFCTTGKISQSRIRFRFAQDAYRRLSGLDSPYRSGQGLHALRTRDPILHLLNVDHAQPAEELIVAHGVRLMLQTHHDDSLFQSCFWQYQRVRNTIYRHIVTRRMTPGLQWFIRHFGRLSPGKRSIDPQTFLESALRTSGKACGLKSLEVRTSPMPTTSSALKFVRKVYEFAADQRKEEREVGIVFHIVKDRSKHMRQGKENANAIGTVGEPGRRRLGTKIFSHAVQYGSTARFSRYYSNTNKSVQVLANLLKHFPLSLQVIRGFDCCTDELGVENWVLVPLYDQMRRAAADARNRLFTHFGKKLALPRSTVHAGEDFIHILSGLRHMDESIDWLNLGEGDRIGHGLALGVEAADWARRVGNVTMRAEQRLFDLVWEWNFYSRPGVSCSVSRLRFIESAIDQLSHFIFGAPPSNMQINSIVDRSTSLRWPPTARTLVQLRENLAKPDMLIRAGFFSGRVPGERVTDSDVQLMVEYLFRIDVFRRGQTKLVVNSVDFAEDLLGIQDGLRSKVERKGIAIEVNPSSNLLLGDLGDPKNHPLWRLNSPGILNEGKAIPIVVGSDDPITFASSLPEEYQKLADALIEHGCSEAATMQWLDAVRESSMRFRFTFPVEDAIEVELSRCSGP